MFSSIPFSVKRGYRFRTGTVEGVIGVVVRGIPSEADPREERIFLIAERPVGSADAYQVAYFDRAVGGVVGGVEAPRSIDVLTAVTLVPSHRLTLILDYMFNEGGSIGFVQRVAPGKWQATWESAYVGC